MTKKNNHGAGRVLKLVVLGLFGLGTTIAILLQGTDLTLFNPKGWIAEQQLNLALFTMLLLLAITIPTLIILYSFAWIYRETDDTSNYNPNTRHGKFSVVSMWALPSIFMLVLALVVGPATHRLDPKKPIVTNAKPLTIQVVALRWKWLFIYPEQNIATVNYVQLPVDRPVQFELTGDEAPMNSFWIPNLGGQLYAMTGHVNRLNLIAQEAGDYPGSTAEISGQGFAGMKFTARASSQAAFDGWVQSVQQSSASLDKQTYASVLKPSENNPPVFYSSVKTDLYATILKKYAGPQSSTASHHGSGGNE